MILKWLWSTAELLVSFSVVCILFFFVRVDGIHPAPVPDRLPPPPDFRGHPHFPWVLNGLRSIVCDGVKGLAGNAFRHIFFQLHNSDLYSA